jgi:hypothetical protein
MFFIFGACLGGLIGYLIAKPKERGGAGFALGFFLGPIGWIIAALLSSSFVCKMCGGSVSRGFPLCRHCGNPIDWQAPVAPVAVPLAPVSPAADESSPRKSPRLIIVGMLSACVIAAFLAYLMVTPSTPAEGIPTAPPLARVDQPRVGNPPPIAEQPEEAAVRAQAEADRNAAADRAIAEQRDAAERSRQEAANRKAEDQRRAAEQAVQAVRLREEQAEQARSAERLRLWRSGNEPKFSPLAVAINVEIAAFEKHEDLMPGCKPLAAAALKYLSDPSNAWPEKLADHRARLVLGLQEALEACPKNNFFKMDKAVSDIREGASGLDD